MRRKREGWSTQLYEEFSLLTSNEVSRQSGCWDFLPGVTFCAQPDLLYVCLCGFGTAGEIPTKDCCGVTVYFLSQCTLACARTNTCHVQTWKDTEDRAHLTKPWTFLMWQVPPELFSQAPWTATTKKWPFPAYSILEEMLTACHINCALVKFNHDSLSFHWVSRDPWGTAQV